MTEPDYRAFEQETVFEGHAAGVDLGRYGLVKVGERKGRIALYPDDAARFVAQLAIAARQAGLRPTSDGRLVQDTGMTESSLARFVDWLTVWTGVDHMVGTHGQYRVEPFPDAWAYRVSCQRSGHAPLKRLQASVYDRDSGTWRVPAADAEGLAAVLERAVTAKIVTDTTDIRLPEHKDLKVDFVEGEIQVGFPRDETLISMIRAVKGIRWNPSIKRWCVSARYRRSLNEALGRMVAELENRDFAVAEMQRAKAGAIVVGRDYWDRVKAEGAPLSTEHIDVRREADSIIVRSPYADEVVTALRSFGGRWDSGRRVWVVPISEIVRLHEALAGLEAAYRRSAPKPESVGARVPSPAGPRQLYPVGSAPAVGSCLRLQGRWVVVESYGRPVTIDDEDPSIWGAGLLGHEGGKGVMVYCRHATDAEVEAAEGAEAARQETLRRRRDRRLAFRELVDRVRRPENYVKGQNQVVGEILTDTWNIYGSGIRWVVAADGLWYLENNGRDGDDWSRNNVVTGGAGAIGWRVSRDAELEDVLRRLVAEERDDT